MQSENKYVEDNFIQDYYEGIYCRSTIVTKMKLKNKIKYNFEFSLIGPIQDKVFALILVLCLKDE